MSPLIRSMLHINDSHDIIISFPSCDICQPLPMSHCVRWWDGCPYADGNQIPCCILAFRNSRRKYFRVVHSCRCTSLLSALSTVRFWASCAEGMHNLPSMAPIHWFFSLPSWQQGQLVVSWLSTDDNLPATGVSQYSGILLRVLKVPPVLHFMQVGHS